MSEPVQVGLIGAGHWARKVHAPGLVAHPKTELTLVWARKPEAAARLADATGTAVATSVENLLDQVDAVAFAVPPSVQAELACQAASAGKHLILEKPLAPDVASAQRVVDAVDKAGVAALMMLTMRYSAATKAWLRTLAETGVWAGGSAKWLSGALLGEVYGNSAWRHESGALADVGPHALDLLDAAIGPITRVLAANRTSEDLWQLIVEHENGATSTATLSLRLAIEPSIVELSVYGEHGYRTLERQADTASDSYRALLDDLTAMVETGSSNHPCDVHRGLHLQNLLDQARNLATEGTGHSLVDH
jgi:predicted dehydrogenase